MAAYIAKKCKVDFVFVDRTFSSLYDVAYYSFGGPFLAWVFRILTRWTEPCWQNYMDIGKDTYKVMGCDAEDKIVTDLASLKNGVGRTVAREKMSVG